MLGTVSTRHVKGVLDPGCRRVGTLKDDVDQQYSHQCTRFLVYVR